MRAICIARHRFLGEHVRKYLAGLDLPLDATAVVGLEAGVRLARSWRPDVVFCDYDLLAVEPLAGWEDDPVLCRIPVIAVSLTRRPEELHPLQGESGFRFLYLPAAPPEGIARIVRAASGPVRPPADALRWSDQWAPQGPRP